MQQEVLRAVGKVPAERFQSHTCQFDASQELLPLNQFIARVKTDSVLAKQEVHDEPSQHLLRRQGVDYQQRATLRELGQLQLHPQDLAVLIATLLPTKR